MESKVNKVNYIWSIPNFSLRPEKTGELIRSPTFVIGSKERSEWCLLIYPNGYEEDFKEFVSLYLCMETPNKTKVKYKFYILNDKGKRKNIKDPMEPKDFDRDNFVVRGFPDFVKKYYLLDKSNGLLVNDKLTILCKVEIIDPEYENHENSIPYDDFCTVQINAGYFKYKYTIENFSLRPEKTGEVIFSPTFKIGSKERSEWRLQIYPNGRFKALEEYVSVYLFLIKPHEAKIKFKISILNDKEEEKNVVSSIVPHYFSRDTKHFWGIAKFVKRDFLLNKSSGLLINDKLTILCEAETNNPKSGNLDNSKPFYDYCSIQTGVNYFKYRYLIRNFLLRSEKTGELIRSPTFVIGSKERSEWCFWIYPNGDEEESKEFVSVYLVLLKPDKAKVKYRFSILNDEEEEKNVEFVTESKDFAKDKGSGFSYFVKRDFLLNESNGLLVNNCLVIFCEADIIDFKYENHDNSEASTNISIPPSKLLSDYGNLFGSPLFYDCVIKVEDTEIQVQKAVLAARSPTFHDIYSSASEESQTNIIEIKDFNVEVVREMLKYIYTDEVSDIHNMADQMFEIANKYGLDRLKAIAEQSMCSSLSIENVLERFALSDKYPTEWLKECCEEIILKNMECLSKTKDWKKYIRSNPSLLGRLLFKSHSINSTECSSEDENKE
uniref:Speckle-type POZ protein-like (inferred by orthology to a human protein) n=1 Tax=Strongyloides papillosus TaxID=174720 RepID=A0A0N5CAB1_STREA